MVDQDTASEATQNDPSAPWERAGTTSEVDGRSRRWFGIGKDAAPPSKISLDPGPLTLQRGRLRRRRYSTSTISVLTRRYVKIRGDLLVSVGDGSNLDPVSARYAERCSDYLHAAKQQLSGRQANFFVCTSLLFLAEVTLVWLYPKGMLDLRCEAVQARLQALRPRAPWLERSLVESRQRQDDRFLRSALEDALNHLQMAEQDAAIADDLQVTRLKSLIVYIAIALGLLMLAVPYVTLDLSTSIEGWPVARFPSALATQWVSAGAVCAIGAVGGIFSGLISVRDSTTTLLEYRASMLKLALKPLVGAVASLTLYLLLSWQILTGIQVTNGGTFLLVGFLAGFSERYFLRLLRAELPRDGNPDMQSMHGSPAGAAHGRSVDRNDDVFDSRSPQAGKSEGLKPNRSKPRSAGPNGTH